MKKILIVFVLVAAALSGCGNRDVVKLDFKKIGECWQVPERQFDRYAEILSQASKEDAVRLLDMGYSIADSIALAEADGTLLVFADDMQRRFFDPNSPLRNDEIYSMALERESLCDSWTSFDQKRISWAQRLLENNAVGSAVKDIVLGGEEETTLHHLIDRPVVFLLYGEKCAACSELIDALGKSDFLLEKAASGEIRLVSMYVGDDPQEFVELSRRLEGWNNYFDILSSVYSAVTFDIRLVPSLYLIDSDKTVLVRGTLNVGEIENKLVINHNN